MKSISSDDLDVTETVDKPSEGKKINCEVPCIKIVEGGMNDTMAQIDAAINSRSGRNIYQRSGHVVYVKQVKMRTWQKGVSTDIQHIVSMEKEHLTAMLEGVCTLVKFNKKTNKWLPVSCPDKLAEIYLKNARELPYIGAIINAPTILSDGSIVENPGYDPGSELLFDPKGVAFPRIPPEPSEDAARAALKVLQGPIAYFPFEGETPKKRNSVSRSVALAGMITPLIRSSLPTAPMIAYTAPETGTGKSLLTDINSILMSGVQAAVISQGYRDDELDKRIDTALIEGRLLISIDNCERQLQSDVLCQVLTQPHRGVRILGLSKSITVPTNVNVNCNGNNLSMHTDLIRRSVLCTIDAKVENPSKRKFPFDPVQFVTKHRPRLVVAALTILRAYQITNRKVKLDPFGSFEAWSARVREALVWLGLEDPCSSQERLREKDTRKGTLASVMAAWRAHPDLGNSKHTAAEVIQIVAAPSPLVNMFPVDASASDNLHQELIATVLRRGDRQLNPHNLGNWLMKVADQVIDGEKFKRVDYNRHTRVSYWQIVPGNE
jgi:putative DNA primase/helicase